MKKIIMKAGVMIVAIATMITMNACSELNNKTANDVCDALSEKYEESFVAVKIGDRFNTNSAKLYVHPSDNENILFTASINKDTGIVEDNYIEEKVNYQVEEILKNAFEKNGISSSSRSMVITNDTLDVMKKDYTPKSFSDEYEFDHYTIYLVLKEGNYSSSEILDSIKAANETIGVNLVVVGYIFNEERYLECSSEIQSNPDMGITLIESKSPLSSFDVNVEHGSCSITAKELSEKIMRY
jgi:hypothetical protein